MTKDWESHKNEIENLYMANGHTLQAVRKIMSTKHTFNASIRSYKMKLDEWKMWKHTLKTPRRTGDTNSRVTTAKPSKFAPHTNSRRTSAQNSPEGSYISISKLPSMVLKPLPDPSEEPPLLELQSGARPLRGPSLITSTIGFGLPGSGNTLVEVSPLVNSSLKFFSTRTDSENLRLLARYPGVAPWALEILLRHWKPGGECMQYAVRFLQEPAYCCSIVGLNWTRWSDYDHTLFDLVLENVPEDEQAPLIKALLKSDLQFQQPLAPRNAPWATIWRQAIQQSWWDHAINDLMRLKVQKMFRNCAMVVVAEHSLLRIKRFFDFWEARDADPSRGVARKLYQTIVKDCIERQIEIDGYLVAVASVQMSLPLPQDQERGRLMPETAQNEHYPPYDK